MDVSEAKELYGDCRHKIKTFGVVIATNPVGTTPLEHKKRMEELQHYFYNLCVQPRPLNQYEQGFIVINMTLGELAGLCRNFGQTSFFFGRNDWEKTPDALPDQTTTSKLFYYKWNNNQGRFKCKNSSARINQASEFDDFFRNHGVSQYSVYQKLFHEYYDGFHDVIAPEYLEESFRRDITAKGRVLFRAKAYRG